MESCLYHPSPTSAIPHVTNNTFFVRPFCRITCNLAAKPSLGLCYSRGRRGGNSFVVKASTGASHCEFSSLNSPLEPKSDVGKFLSGVLQNHRHMFHVAVEEELKLLVDDRDAAIARVALGHASDEDLLHRFVSLFSGPLILTLINCLTYYLTCYLWSSI